MLINQFPNAKLNFFEDGLGDYIIKENWTGYKKAIYVREKYKNICLNILYFFNIKKNIIKYLLVDKTINAQIIFMNSSFVIRKLKEENH